MRFCERTDESGGPFEAFDIGRGYTATSTASAGSTAPDRSSTPGASRSPEGASDDRSATATVTRGRDTASPGPDVSLTTTRRTGGYCMYATTVAMPDSRW